MDWRRYYREDEQREIKAKQQRKIRFPAQLYHLAKQTGRTLPNFQRIEAAKQANLPLLTVDIQALTALVNGQIDIQALTALVNGQNKPTMSRSLPLSHRHRSTAVRKAHGKSARQRLRELLRRYDGLVQSGEAVGTMQFEKHRRYRAKAAAVLNDPQAKNHTLIKQANYLEGQIERLQERIEQRSNW